MPMKITAVFVIEIINIVKDKLRSLRFAISIMMATITSTLQRFAVTIPELLLIVGQITNFDVLWQE